MAMPKLSPDGIEEIFESERKGLYDLPTDTPIFSGVLPTKFVAFRNKRRE